MTRDGRARDGGMAPVTIVGAGIAGLACALALARRGARVRVLERAPALAPVGAGIQISPNGVRVLDALGLAAPLRAASLGNRAVILARGPSGRRVVRMDLDETAYRLVHRADLIELLAGAARDAGVEIAFGQPVATLADGAPARIDGRPAGFVIGADGIRSVVRPVLNGSAEPRFTGQTAWRAVIEGAAPPVARVDMGPGRHLVRYPLPGGRINLVGVVEEARWTAEGWHQPGEPADFRTAFAGFPAAAEDLGAVAEAHLWGLFRHPVAAVWHGRSLAIIGDAAHPTLPFLAQGANLALEDAWTLAAALASGPPDAGALAAWQAARRPRVTRAIAAAEANARAYHLRGPVAAIAGLGLGGIGRIAPNLLPRRFDWLYGHDVTRG